MYSEDSKKLINTFISDKYALDESSLTPNMTFRDDLKIDSLDVIDVIFFIENRFNIKIKIDELATISKLEDLYVLVDKYASTK